MENVKRPAVNETDEDLLREQELFLKTSKKSAAQSVSSEQSRVNAGYLEKGLPEVTESHNKSEKKELETEFGDVIFDVKERDISYQSFVFEPQPVSVEEINHVMNKNIKISKFAARRKAQSIFEQMLNSTNDVNTSEDLNEPEVPESPVLIDGSGLAPDAQDSEVKTIHEENLAKLSSMSVDEIHQHQEQLKNYLKPEILNFIKQRKGKKKDEKSSGSHFQKKTKVTFVESERIPGEILKKAGNKDCDALILEKVLTSEDKDNAYKDQKPGKNNETKKELEPEVPESPVLIDGSGLAPDAQDSEVKTIHEENLAKLSSMSVDEIHQNQEQLKNYLSN